MEGRLESALRTVIQFLDSHHYRYALIGGIALAQWFLFLATSCRCLPLRPARLSLP